MGVDLAAVVGHTLDAAGVLEMPSRLSGSPFVRAAAKEAYSVLKPRWPGLEMPNWSWPSHISSVDTIRDAWARQETAELEDIVGFSVRVGPRALEATHIEKFAAFIQNTDGIQLPVRRLCRAIAAELGSNRAAYLPDSTYDISAVVDMVSDGHSIDDIVSRLAKDFGPPRASIGAILVEDGQSYKVDGYFIDDFCNLGPEAKE